MTWQNIARLAGLVIVAFELRQLTVGAPVDQRDLSLLVIAAGLMGLATAFRRNGGGGGGGSGSGSRG